ncbi:MAG: hypothetical protein IPL70_16000 [Uliginosibacterium sp.]|nr:hypothetical protein [Uliginosibacterium sp.]
MSVERLIEAAGIELKKSSKDLAGRCPFHADDTASLIVTPAKNLWHRFGCCVAAGRLTVMKKNGGLVLPRGGTVVRGVPVVSSLLPIL